MNIKYLISFTFLILYSVCSYGQVDTEFQIKSLTKTGIRIGAYTGNNILELGVGRILIDKPCNQSKGNSFAPLCGFPKKLEIDATFEVNLTNRPLYGQKVTLLYTLLASSRTKDFNHKILYYTFGHALLGLSVVNYTPDFRTSNKIFLRPEVSWMAPQRIKMLHHHQSDRLELNVRVVYSYNIISNINDAYGMTRHNFGLLFLFLYTKHRH
jgi:hypothetical protein